MTDSRLTAAPKTLSDHDKIAEIEQMILLRQKNAEMVRANQKKTNSKNIPSLTEEFFEGLRIV